MAATATLTPSNFYGGRSRSRVASSDSRSAYTSATLPRAPASSNPIVQYTKEVERMRAERNRQNGDTATGSFGGSNSSLDRAGLASPVSPGPSYSGATNGYATGRPSYTSSSSTSATNSSVNSRNSILESGDFLKPVISSPYSRMRTPSASESLYDYSLRSGSLVRRRPGESRDASSDRMKDLRNRNGRRVPNGDSDVEDEVSMASTTTTYRGGLPPHATSQLQYSKGHAHNGSPKIGSLQRYDSTSSLRSGRYTPTTPTTPTTSNGFNTFNTFNGFSNGMRSSASSGTLQRYGSNSSLVGSRKSSRGDLSVNFDLRHTDSGRPERTERGERGERGPIVLVSRVAVEKEIPISEKLSSDVESRYVVGKFSTGEEGGDVRHVRHVPIQMISDTPTTSRERERSMSRDRSTVPVRGREPVKVQPTMGVTSSGVTSLGVTSLGYGSAGRMQSGERVVGGKQFLSDSSLADSSSDEDGPLGHVGGGGRGARGNSIIRAGSPPSVRRPILVRKGNFSVDESEKAGLIGLKNLGNTCFMNSILQCLSNTRPLRDYCLLGDYECDVNTTTSQMKGALISAFASVLEALWKKHTSYSPSSPYVPDKFHRQVQQYAPRFSGYLQQDAQEFLRYLLEGLHEDVNRVTEKPRPESAEIPHNLNDAQKASESWKRYLKRDNSKIVDLFVGQLKSSLICQSCGYCSVTCDPFWDLSLPIPGSRGSGRRSDPTLTTNLTECFKLFTKEEMLEGDECPTCCHCKTRQKCRKFFSIQRFPKYFVIHLKRFSQERFRAKLSTLVEYPAEQLDLSSFGAESYEGPPPLYNLYAVSCHSGSTHCGHYTAFCKHPVSGKWNEYNDARVTAARVDDVVTPEAYVLFYELVS